MTNLAHNLPAWQRFAAKYLGWAFMKTIPQGAATSCYVATSPDLADASGFYFSDSNVADDAGYLLDDAMAKQLWTVSEDLTREYLPGA
jgi:WW domain-containing oxidoreductase